MMTHEMSSIYAILFLLGIILGLMLIAYEDGVKYSLAKRIQCKLGKHTFYGYYKKPLYYCQKCKTPRKHPSMKALKGGKKDIDNFYKFWNVRVSPHLSRLLTFGLGSYPRLLIMSNFFGRNYFAIVQSAASRFAILIELFGWGWRASRQKQQS